MNIKSLPPNSCHRCGSTTYRQVIARDERGAMMPTGRSVCTGCKFQFGAVSEWRNGVAEEQTAGRA